MRLEYLISYFKKSLNELQKVNWLSQKETLNLTWEVIVFSLTFIFLYGIIDSILVSFLLLFK